MHILIATAGALPPGPVADFVERWGKALTVSVLTVVEVPRPFLHTLEAESWHPFDETGGRQPDELAARYVEERGRKRTQPVIAALEVRGVSADAIFREGNDPALVIEEVASEVGADLIVMGATRPIFAEDSWNSVSLRVMQGTRRPLLLIPGSSPSVDPDEPESSDHAIPQELAT